MHKQAHSCCNPTLRWARVLARQVGIEEEQLSWYLDLRKYGTVPHAGFGLGFERLVMLVTVTLPPPQKICHVALLLTRYLRFPRAWRTSAM